MEDVSTVERSPSQGRGRLRRWILGARRGYTAVAVLGLNTLVLLFLLNLGVGMLFRVRGAIADKAPYRNLNLKLNLSAYPGWSPEQLELLLEETHQPLMFEPFAHFKHRPIHGRYVNVEAVGFRRVRDQAPWPPLAENTNIFFFGGSTTFGYNLPDAESIPSCTQEILAVSCPGRRVAVYNFGRGYYFSTQERIIFEQLLLAGWKPDLAVFMDGLNDLLLPQGVPEGSSRLEAAIEGGGPRPSLFEDWPLMRAVRGIRARLAPAGPPPGVEDLARVRSRETADTEARQVLDRWFANKAILEAIGEKNSIRMLFVWQPVPNFGYDVSYHPFMAPDWLGKTESLTLGYPMMQARAEAEKPPNFLWLGDMQRDRKESLYVDQLHYTATFSREIARRIADQILAGPLPCPK